MLLVRNDTLVQIANSIDIAASSELRNLLLERLASESSLQLDLSAVEDCDAAGIQLLCAAQKSALAAGKPFSVVHASDAVKEACAELNVDPAKIFEAAPALSAGKEEAQPHAE